VDPVTFMETGDPRMFNRYAYTFNDPINHTDPDGEIGKVIITGFKVARRTIKTKGDFKGSLKHEAADFIDNFATLADGKLDLNDLAAIVDLGTGIDAELIGDAKAGLKRAEKLRDNLSDALGSKTSAVSAGFNKRTGVVAAGRSCGGGKGGSCAKDVVVEALCGNKDDIVFTKSVFSRKGTEKPICTKCEDRFGKDKFPEGTKFESD